MRHGHGQQPGQQKRPGGEERAAWLEEGDHFDGLGEDGWRAAMEALSEEGPDSFAGGADLADDGEPWDNCPWDDRDAPVLGFGPGDAGERMAPGVSLGMLAEYAVTSGDLAGMADDAVVGLIGAARRLRCRAEWLELRGTREFARRRWESDATAVRDGDGRWLLKNSVAEHAADELAFHLTDSRAQAGERMELSLALPARLPRMDALLAAGRIDERRVQAVADITAGLTEEQARQVDERLAPDAPDLPYTALRRRAAKLAMSLAPEAERKRKERATRRKARVEKFMERSGNYALAVREMPVEEILASEQHIRALAAYLRAHGVRLGQRETEVMVYLDLTQGRDPLDRIAPGHRDDTGDHTTSDHTGGDRAGNDRSNADHTGGDRAGNDRSNAGRTGGDGSGRPDDQGQCGDNERWRDGPWDDYDDWDEDDQDGDGNGGDDGNGGGGGSRRPWPFGPPGPGRPGGRAPFAATINLLVPVGTVFGWSAMPGESGRDIIDPQTLRDMIQAASRHGDTRWCVTLIGADGTAIAHGCARGRHTWDAPPAATAPASPAPASTTPARANAPPVGTRSAQPPPAQPPPAQPPPAQAAALAQFLARLKINLDPIAKGTCDHRHAEPRYRPGRKLGHLTRARNATCPAPACHASSWQSDMDHTTPWPQGSTDECNIGLPCRHHHRTKQAPHWNLEQPEPGVFRWTTPSGLTYITRPTRYDL